MFDLHILGTSGSRPTGKRSVSGNYLSTPHGNLIIDCGEGFQDRLIKHELDLKKNPIGIRARASKIKVILLTHSHLDHCWGLLPLLKTMQLDGRTKPLTIIKDIAGKCFPKTSRYARPTSAWLAMYSDLSVTNHVRRVISLICPPASWTIETIFRKHWLIWPIKPPSTKILLASQPICPPICSVPSLVNIPLAYPLAGSQPFGWIVLCVIA